MSRPLIPTATAEEPRARDGFVLFMMVVAGLLAVGLVVDSITSVNVAKRKSIELDAPAELFPGVADNFDRADTTADLGRTGVGSTWSTIGGSTWGVSNGQARVTRADKGVSLTTVRSGAADGRIEVTATKVAVGLGLALRCRGPLNCFRVEAVPQFGTWNVVKVVAGVESKVGGLGTVSVADGTKLAIETSGSIMTFFVNGKQAAAFDDPDLQGDDRVGLSLREAASATGARWDDFSVTVINRPGVVDPARATIRDEFERNTTNGLGGDGGAAWREVTGRWRTTNGLATMRVSDQRVPSLALVDTGSPDGIVQTTIYAPQQNIGVAFRCRDANNCWRIQAALGYGTWNVSKIIAGKATKVMNIGVQPTSPGTTVSVRSEGTKITVYVNGEQAAAFEAPELRTETGAGLVIEAGKYSARAGWTEFLAGPLGATK